MRYHRTRFAKAVRTRQNPYTYTTEAIIFIRLELPNISMTITLCELAEPITLAIDKGSIIRQPFDQSLHDLIRSTAMWDAITVHCSGVISGTQVCLNALLHHGGRNAIWVCECVPWKLVPVSHATQKLKNSRTKTRWQQQQQLFNHPAPQHKTNQE